jgi:hypothetical protein
MIHDAIHSVGPLGSIHSSHGGEEENLEVENEAGDIEGDGIECIEIDSAT